MAYTDAGCVMAFFEVALPGTTFGIASAIVVALATSFATTPPDTLQAAWAFLTSRRARANHAMFLACMAEAVDAAAEEDMLPKTKRQVRRPMMRDDTARTCNWQRMSGES